ncbi:MAG: DNA replication and repair protein RecF [Flavobacteriales bacterium]|nr:DNA replication and repair protein RecF [Flavobacteriales bacterium]
MYLSKLHIVNFKNFQGWEADFSPKINSLVGANGVGKTNILDAVYYLCFTKSYFAATDVQNIRFGEPFMMLEGVFSHENTNTSVLMSLQRGAKKTVKRSGKVIERMSDYIGSYPLVVVSPSDRDLIAEGSALRRKFMDGVISQTSASYLDALLSHARVVEMRNALLKTPNASSLQLDIYDSQMLDLGAKIWENRKLFLEKFTPVFQKIYADISGGAEMADLTYNSIFNSDSPEEELISARTKDLMLGFSTTGAHKDDLRFTLGGYPVKRYGSQGQQKTFLTALKLAQFSFMTSLSGQKPILLLDDIFDKLDSSRVEYIIHLVHSDTFGQVFISDTQAERISAVMNSSPIEHKMFTIE